MNHDALGRLVLAFLDGEARCGLPRAPALLAFGRLHHLDAVALVSLREVLAFVEGAEKPRLSTTGFFPRAVA